MEFSDSETERFIIVVQQHQCLYNMSLTSYRNKNVRSNAWKRVAEEMHSDVSSCMKRWKCLKDRYRRYKAKYSKSGSAANQTRNEWALAKAMEFIDPFCVSRKTHSNLTFTVGETEESIQDDNMYILSPECSSSFVSHSGSEDAFISQTSANTSDSLSEICTNTGSLRESPEDTPLPRAKSKRKAVSVESDTDKIIKELRSASAFGETEDEDDLFFASLSKKTKHLAPERRSKLQLKILEVVHDALYNE